MAKGRNSIQLKMRHKSRRALKPVENNEHSENCSSDSSLETSGSDDNYVPLKHTQNDLTNNARPFEVKPEATNGKQRQREEPRAKLKKLKEDWKLQEGIRECEKEELQEVVGDVVRSTENKDIYKRMFATKPEERHEETGDVMSSALDKDIYSRMFAIKLEERRGETGGKIITKVEKETGRDKIEDPPLVIGRNELDCAGLTEAKPENEDELKKSNEEESRFKKKSNCKKGKKNRMRCSIM